MSRDGVEALASVRLARPTGKWGATATRRAAVVVLSLVGCALIVLYWHEVAGAVQGWYGTRGYNHGFLIIPIVGYLIWERRAPLAKLVPEPFPAVLALIPVCGVIWLVART